MIKKTIMEYQTVKGRLQKQGASLGEDIYEGGISIILTRKCLNR